MKSLLLRYATPFITGLFIVSLVSGLALFFHIGPSGFRGMHEWLSLVLIVPFVLHIWKNWRPMLCYFKGVPFAVASVVSLVAAGVFLLPAGEGERKGPPQFALVQMVLNSTVAEVAPLMDLTPEALTEKLTAAGINVDPSLSLSAMAEAAGKTTMNLAQVLAAR